MNHGPNLHVLPNNCVIVSQANSPSPQSPAMMHSHQSMHYQHQYNSHMQSHQSPVPQAMHPQNQNQISPEPPHHRLGKRLIAPAPINRSLTEQNRITSSKKPKLAYAHMPYGAAQPQSVQRRNARERNRVKQVNNGFANLRQHIPSDVITALSHGGRGASKKLSKVDTLRLAVEYIRRLQDLIDDNDAESSSSSSSRLSQGSAGSYYPPSPMQCSSIPPPSCSDSSASPTPSYTSENSSVTAGAYVTPAQYKYEGFDPCNPEDDELLDCIAWWQQQ